MSGYDLPTSAEVGGVEYAIRSDYRAILDVVKVIGDLELSDRERAHLVLSVFYPDFDEMPPSCHQEALDYVFWFVAGGKGQGSRKPRVMDWDQDFSLIVAPVNRVLGFEVRAVEYMHWWTFLAAYCEIGDCLFAQVVSIRKKKLRGQKLDKADEAFYRENRDLVDLDARETKAETEMFDKWTKG